MFSPSTVYSTCGRRPYHHDLVLHGLPPILVQWLHLRLRAYGIAYAHAGTTELEFHEKSVQQQIWDHQFLDKAEAWIAERCA
jgi:hypothetical protein